MYLSRKIIQNIFGSFDFYQNNLIAVCGNHLQSNICIYDDDFNMIFKNDYESAYDFIIEQDKVIFTTQKSTKSYYSIISNNQLENVCQLPFVLHIKGLKWHDNYICFANIFDEECYLLIDLKTMNISQKYSLQKGFCNSKHNFYSGIILFFGNQFISILSNNGIIGLFNLNNDIIWQHDLSTLSSYTNYEGKATKGEIRKVYEYEDSVIVITQMYIFRISIASGDIIYHKKLPAGMLSLSIHQNKAYGCYGHHYLELDLNSGEVVLFCRIEQEEYKGERFFAYMNEAFYYEGLVYHGIRLSNGVHGVGIIDSSTGKRIWFHPTGVHNIETIKFHQNRLYVKDAGACLHIFEKE